MRSICEILELAKADTDYMETVLKDFEPLVKKYARKMFFLEYEEAFQELELAIIEAVHRIEIYPSDAQCMTYISRAVIYAYRTQCNQNIRKVKCVNLDEIYPYWENFSDIEFFADLEKKFCSLSASQKTLLLLLIQGESDSEIAELLHVSRQYVNKAKKKLFTH